MIRKLYDIVNQPIDNMEEFIRNVYEVVKVNDNVNVEFGSDNLSAGAYKPYCNEIVFNKASIKKFIKEQIHNNLENCSKGIFELCVKLELVNLVLHENTHVKQQLIVDDKISSNYPFYDQACKDIYGLIIHNQLMCRYYLKYRHDDMFFEREAYLNGNREAMKLALMFDSNELYEFFKNEVNYYIMLGYYQKFFRSKIFKGKAEQCKLSLNGAIKTSYKAFFLGPIYNRLIIPDNLPFCERIDLGLEVPEEDLIDFMINMLESSNEKTRVRVVINDR